MCELKALREARGLTQEQLSELSGVNRASIARYETSVRVSMTIDTAKRLAGALGCTVSALLGEKPTDQRGDQDNDEHQD